MAPGDELFEKISAQIKTDFGDLWDANKDSLQDWTKIIVKLQKDSIAGKGANNDLAIKYAWAGLACLKARLQYKLESQAFATISKILQIVLETAIIMIRRG